MDIEYLLLLQNFRNGVGGFLAPFTMWLSNFTIGFIPTAIMCMLYWSVDRKGGRKILLANSIDYLVNGFLKLTLCIYRPWIRDARIEPYGTSKTTATGYSFPSGHATVAGGTFGAVGVWLYKRGKKLMAIISFVFVLLVMFSRNYLGVHTPQDVFVGAASSFVVLFAASKIEDWTDKDPNRDKIVAVVGLLLCAALVAYYELKSYPLAYQADGSLLVDPAKMKIDSYSGLGFFAAFVVCRYFERRGFNFEAAMSWKDRFIVGTVALIPLYIWMSNISPLIIHINGAFGLFTEYAVLAVYVLIAVPNVMRCVHDKNLLKEKVC